tara:strand:+ start:205 stop:1656 length:1452 start_codon:yes stop_codon:yes gene_type:complete
MAAITPSAGSNLNSVAAPTKQTLASNYVDFTSSATEGWAQQYLPDIIEKEAEVFGNRTISGFLSQVGAEESMASDRVIWSEQGRLHLSYEGAAVTNAGVITIASAGTHAVRVGQTIVLSDNQSSPKIIKCYISAVAADNTTLTAIPYSGGADVGSVSGFDTATDSGSNTCDLFVYGSEFKKGQSGMSDAVTPQHKTFVNKPIIIKDKFEVSGSDTAAIGWVEISGEEGQNGYLWYLKAEGDTKARFTDYLEMACVEGELAKATGGVDSLLGTAATDDTAGTEGLFAAITDRGHVTSGIAGTSASDDLGSFDEILKKFDAQGAIEENMLYVNRSVSLAMDDMLAAQNSYGAGGTSYGVFNNDEDMALNLGFSGFRRGSYDFYKTDWKYLNDASLRGMTNISDVRGVVIPAGVSTVYDQSLGKNLKRPFLHVRYRASQADDRKLKSWITGSVGGNITSDLDAMEVHYLSERCLVVQGANNFMLLN